MCYRCEVCHTVTEKGQSLLKHVIYRRVQTPITTKDRESGRIISRLSPVRNEIYREVAICPACNSALSLGIPFATLLRQSGVAIALGDAAERARRLRERLHATPALPTTAVLSPLTRDGQHRPNNIIRPAKRS